MKIRRLITLLIVLCACYSIGSTISDKENLQKSLIRLHVIANSDSDIDQARKLMVRDAVIDYLQPKVEKIKTKEQAKILIESELQNIESVANRTLTQADAPEKAKVTLSTEYYDTRLYDTFKLPAGVYDSLKITIGEHKGKNWWCVVFPSLCLPATTDSFESVAVSAGFDSRLANTLSENRKFEIRFFLLDFLGRIEKVVCN